MRIIDCIQGTPEWNAAKCGIPSASNFDKIVDTKGNPSKQRTKYLYQLVGERITKTSEATYTNGNMERGKILEEEARAYYQALMNKTVKQAGFCVTEGKAIYGCSPDGLVGKEGLIEIKCPIMSTQVSYLSENMSKAPMYRLPLDYFQQVQGQLLVTGRKWNDFISYYPGMKPFVVRVKPDNLFLGRLKRELELFCSDLDKIVKKLRR